MAGDLPRSGPAHLRRVALPPRLRDPPGPLPRPVSPLTDKVERGPGIALPFRLLLAIAVASLGVAVLLVATGGFARVASAIGSSFGGFVGSITATPVPSAADPEAADSPVLEVPDEPYTNQPTVDLQGTVPASVAGDTESRIRIYVAIGDGDPGVVTEIPVGETQRFVVPDVALSAGTNTFTATIVGPTDLESEASAAVVLHPRHEQAADHGELAEGECRGQREDGDDQRPDAGPEHGQRAERGDERRPSAPSPTARERSRSSSRSGPDRTRSRSPRRTRPATRTRRTSRSAAAPAP